MKLSEYLNTGRIINKRGKLLIDIPLDDGETRKKGDIISILMDKGNGTFHAEDNDWAATISLTEFEWVNNK